MNVNIEIVFLDFLKNDVLDLRGLCLFGWQNRLISQRSQITLF